MTPFQRDSLVTLDVESLAYGGEGVAKPDGFVVFVRKAAPGDRLRVRITQRKKTHASAEIESIEQASPRRIDPPCPLFDRCGGCSWQHLPYEDQLEWKQRQIVEIFDRLKARLPSIGEFTVQPMLASPAIWHYRNKMEYTFGVVGGGPSGERKAETILGFHLPGRFDSIFAVDRCLIHPPAFDVMLRELTDYARRENLPPYIQRTHEGLLRHAVMRHSATTDDVILMLTSASGELPALDSLAQRLKTVVPGFKGMVWGTNDGLADVAVMEHERFRWGDPTLLEEVNGIKFQISPQAFFQTNTAAAALLYRRVIEIAGLRESDRVLDAYCGAGAIALHCARAAEIVVGVDINREGIWNARSNAILNGIGNATFIAADMAEGLPLAFRAARRDFTHVIIDPPRGGMDKRSLRQLIELGAPSFIYVSCNPTTLARDMEKLTEGGYALEIVQPIDMFPHTYHIEAIVRLAKRN